jgi:type IV fimbrial biogenesis protein FimT
MVLFLVGISTALAYPHMRTFINNQRMSTETNTFYTDIAFARSEAIKRNMRVVICPAAAGNCLPAATSFTTGWLIFADVNDNGTYDAAASEPLLKVVNGLSSSRQRLVNLNSNVVNRITIDSRGSIPSATGATAAAPLPGNALLYALCDERDPAGSLAQSARLITLSFTGQIQIRGINQTDFPGLQCPP